MEPVVSQEYSWKWITASEKLTDLPCELLMVTVVPSGVTTTTIVYDGIDANGKEIAQFSITVVLNWDFVPPKPIYCLRGLYVTVGAAVTGVFVMWRNLGHKEGVG